MWDAGNVAIRFVGCRSPHVSGAAAVNAANAQSAILAGLLAFPRPSAHSVRRTLDVSHTT
jgi:hypothetical protein